MPPFAVKRVVRGARGAAAELAVVLDAFSRRSVLVVHDVVRIDEATKSDQGFAVGIELLPLSRIHAMAPPVISWSRR